MTDHASAAILPEDMLVETGYSLEEDITKRIKDEMYNDIVRYLDVETSPIDRLYFTVANVNDLDLFIITPIIHGFNVEQAVRTSNCIGKK